MAITEFQYKEMLSRLSKTNREPKPAADAVSREVADLHYPIIEWCRKQRPPVPYIHARTDQESTIALGAPDFAIFWRGKTILIECKTRTGKLSAYQAGWSMLAEHQKFKVHVVRSMREFYDILLKEDSSK